MIQLKEVIQYYIGQRCSVIRNNGRENEDIMCHGLLMEFGMNGTASYHINTIKPILRRLEDMTEDDLKNMINEFLIIDLSKCSYEFETEEGNKWANAIENGRVIASLVILDDGHVSIETMNADGDMSHLWPMANGFHYLLKQGFDLFGLCDSRQAIDSKTLNQKA